MPQTLLKNRYDFIRVHDTLLCAQNTSGFMIFLRLILRSDLNHAKGEFRVTSSYSISYWGFFWGGFGINNYPSLYVLCVIGNQSEFHILFGVFSTSGPPEPFISFALWEYSSVLIIFRKVTFSPHEKITLSFSCLWHLSLIQFPDCVCVRMCIYFFLCVEDI